MRVRIAIMICLMIAARAMSAFAISFVTEPMTIEKSYNHAASVFSGVAVSCDTIPPGENMVFPSGVDVWTFSVGQVWKGPAVSQIVVATGQHLPHGLYPFEVGKQYVVFANLHFDRQSLVVSRYSPTAEVEAAIAQRYFLGQGVVVNQGLSLPAISEEEGRNSEFKCPFFIDASPDPPAFELMDIGTKSN